jgi:hypothetical protein
MTTRALSIQIIGLIRTLNNVSIAPTEENQRILKVLAEVVEKGFRLDPWPDKDASFQQTGEFYTRSLDMLIDAVGSQLDNSAAATTCTAQTVGELSAFMNASTGLQTMINNVGTKFMENATKYEESRKSSARKQMGNDGNTPAEIDEVVSDSTKLRRFIQERRAELTAKLIELEVRHQNGRLEEKLTKGEEALLMHHRSWLHSTDFNPDEYLPNDNAVPYLLFVVDMLTVIQNTGDAHATGLHDAYLETMRVFMIMVGRDSYSRTWDSLSELKSQTHGSYDVGEALKAWGSDVKRTAQSDKSVGDIKLQSSTQRTVMRTVRFACVTIHTQNVHTVMNLPAIEAAPQLVRLFGIESQITSLLSTTGALGRGNEGFSAVESMIWLYIIGRGTLFEPVWGRNDLSVPKLIASVSGGDVQGLGDLTARPWSWSAAVTTTGG